MNFQPKPWDFPRTVFTGEGLAVQELRKQCSHSYLHTGSRCYMAYCGDRYNWLLYHLAKAGVSLEHFQPNSREIPKTKCREIAAALKKIKANDGTLDHPLLDDDIGFWETTEGARVMSMQEFWNKNNC